MDGRWFVFLWISWCLFIIWPEPLKSRHSHHTTGRVSRAAIDFLSAYAGFLCRRYFHVARQLAHTQTLHGTAIYAYIDPQSTTPIAGLAVRFVVLPSGLGYPSLGPWH